MTDEVHRMRVSLASLLLEMLQMSDTERTTLLQMAIDGTEPEILAAARRETGVIDQPTTISTRPH